VARIYVPGRLRLQILAELISLSVIFKPQTFGMPMILKDEGLVTIDQLSDSSCSIRLRTAGWKALEEPVEATNSSVGQIFISCGQLTDEEMW